MAMFPVSYMGISNTYLGNLDSSGIRVTFAGICGKATRAPLSKHMARHFGIK